MFFCFIQKRTIPDEKPVIPQKPPTPIEKKEPRQTAKSLENVN